MPRDRYICEDFLYCTLMPSSNSTMSSLPIRRLRFVMALPFHFCSLVLFAASVHGLPQMSGVASTATSPQYPVNTSSESLQSTTSSPSAATATATSGCGAVSAYYGQTTADWNAINMDSWLNDWWNNYSSAITSNSYGFAGAFGNWAIGNPDFNCQTDGSTSDCDFNPCDIVTLNNNPDVQQAYYVMESLNRFHSYFTGLGQAFTTSSIAAALSKDEWAETFYIDKDDKAATILKEILNALGTIIGLVGAFAGLGPTVSIF